MFEIIQIDNQYYLKNNDSFSATYSLSPIENCCSCEQVDVTPIVAPIGANTQILLPISIDGRYEIIIYRVTPEDPLETFTIEYYGTLEQRFIKDSFGILCGDGCIDCNANIEASLNNIARYQTIFNESLALMFMSSFSTSFGVSQCDNCIFSAFMQEAVRLYECDILRLLCIERNTGDFFGKSEGTLELFKKFIAIIYLGLYSQRAVLTTTDEDLKSLKEYFNYCKIERCIRNLGMNVEELIDIYESIYDGCADG